MQQKTILNSIEKQKGFVYGTVKWSDNQSVKEIEIEIQPRLNSSAVCSGYGKKRPGYDRLKPRRFEYVPLWAIAVCFEYTRHANGDMAPPMDEHRINTCGGQRPNTVNWITTIASAAIEFAID